MPFPHLLNHHTANIQRKRTRAVKAPNPCSKILNFRTEDMHTVLTYHGTRRTFSSKNMFGQQLFKTGGGAYSNDDVTIANKAGYNRFLVLIS